MTLAPKFGLAAFCTLVMLVPMFGTVAIVSAI